MNGWIELLRIRKNPRHGNALGIVLELVVQTMHLRVIIGTFLFK